MDPNANLEELRQIAAAILASSDPPEPDDAMRLAELSVALDEWITKGGFLPDVWKREPTAAEIADWCETNGYTLVVEPDAGDPTLAEPEPKLRLTVQFHAGSDWLVVWKNTGDSFGALVARAMRDT